MPPPDPIRPATEPVPEAPPEIDLPEGEPLPPGVPPEIDLPDGPNIGAPEAAPITLPHAVPTPDHDPEPPTADEPTDLAFDRMERDDEDERAPSPIPGAWPARPAAFDRVQRREAEAPKRPRSPLERGFVALFLLSIAVLVVYLAFGRGRADEAASASDLLVLAVDRADDVEPILRTADPAEAEQYVIGEFGWPLRVPALAGTTLVGVGVDEVAPEAGLPVLLYAREGGERVVVYAFDYATLDAAGDRLQLAPAVYARLAEDDVVDVRRLDDRYLVLWRHRAAVYVAVTESDPAPLVAALKAE